MSRFLRITICILILFTVGTMSVSAADIPSGDAYEVTCDEVKAFKKGETVRLTLKVDKITPESGMLGFDITLKMNTDYVTMPIVNGDIEKANEKNATITALNKKAGKWTISGRPDNKDESLLVLTVLEDNATECVMPGSSFEIIVDFTAKQDSAPGAEIFYTSELGGTSGKIETVEGKGLSVKVAENGGDEKPTEKPAGNVTEKPEVKPSATPQKENPTTADPGLMYIAAMAFSALSLINKKFIK